MSHLPFNQINCRRWMVRNLEDHRDPLTNEINSTTLAESCCAAFEVNGLDGPLDDETHWIWTLALMGR